jgi:hypothetical protein
MRMRHDANMTSPNSVLLHAILSRSCWSAGKRKLARVVIQRESKGSATDHRARAAHNP